MFNSITGIITYKFSQTLCIQNHGLEWELTVPLTTLDALPPAGEEAKVYTWLYHREDSMKLFGFATVNERAVFLDLMKVEGVGAACGGIGFRRHGPARKNSRRGQKNGAKDDAHFKR